MNFKSTYGLHKDFSFKGETFYNIPLTWKLGASRIEALKIRVAKWTPKQDRSGQAIIYHDVRTDNEAHELLEKYKSINFKALEKEFDKMYDSDLMMTKNTGETREWLYKKAVPILKLMVETKIDYEKDF